MAASQTELPSFLDEAKPVYAVSEVEQHVPCCSGSDLEHHRKNELVLLSLDATAIE